MQSSPSCLMLLSLSLSCHSPNITSPQSDLTTVVSSPGQNGLICAEREKEKKQGRGAKRENGESGRKEKKWFREWRGMMGRQWIGSVMSRGRGGKKKDKLCLVNEVTNWVETCSPNPFPLLQTEIKSCWNSYKGKKNMLISSRVLIARGWGKGNHYWNKITSGQY